MSSHSIQLNPPIEVETEHGIGWAFVMTDYGPGMNAIWTIGMKSDGRIRHYETNQVRLGENFTFGVNVSRQEKQSL